MPKTKEIMGFPRAVDDIMKLLGAKRMAALLGKSERRMHYWKEEGGEYSPAIRDCLAMDAAYLRAGGKIAPLFEAYRQMLTAVADAEPARPEDFRSVLSKAAFETGEAIAAACKLDDNASAEERREALLEVSEGIAALNELSRQLIASLDPDSRA